MREQVAPVPYADVQQNWHDYVHGAVGTKAQQSRWAPVEDFRQQGGAASIPRNERSFDATRAWTINPKITKELKAFDGKTENYFMWASRVRDHLNEGNQKYGELLRDLEQERETVLFARCETGPRKYGGDIKWVSQHL